MAYLNTADNKISNSTNANMIEILIGLIAGKTKIDDNSYDYYPVIVIGVVLYNGHVIDKGLIRGGRASVSWDIKIGFIGDHIICGIFLEEQRG